MPPKQRINSQSFGRTGPAQVRHCGCDALPWEDCKHTAWDSPDRTMDVAEDEPEVAQALAVARAFHESYERLAPLNGYETRKDTRHFDPTTANGRTMLAVCADLLARGIISSQEHSLGETGSLFGQRTA